MFESCNWLFYILCWFFYVLFSLAFLNTFLKLSLVEKQWHNIYFFCKISIIFVFPENTIKLEQFFKIKFVPYPVSDKNSVSTICTCYLGLWGMTENTVSFLNMLDYIPDCKGSYLASGRAGLFGGQSLNRNVKMGPLVHDESKSHL